MWTIKIIILLGDTDKAVILHKIQNTLDLHQDWEARGMRPHEIWMDHIDIVDQEWTVHLGWAVLGMMVLPA